MDQVNRAKLKEIERLKTKIFFDADNLFKHRISHTDFDKRLDANIEHICKLCGEVYFELGQKQLNIFSQNNA